MKYNTHRMIEEFETQLGTIYSMQYKLYTTYAFNN